jgi:hypothetical protein
MKVSELIALLNTKNQDAEVLVYSDIDEGFDLCTGVCTPQEYHDSTIAKYPPSHPEDEERMFLPYCKGYSIAEQMDDNPGVEYVIVGVGPRSL